MFVSSAARSVLSRRARAMIFNHSQKCAVINLFSHPPSTRTLTSFPLPRRGAIRTVRVVGEQQSSGSKRGPLNDFTQRIVPSTRAFSSISLANWRRPVVSLRCNRPPGVYSTRSFFSASPGGGEPSVASLITRMLAHGAIALVLQYPLKSLLVIGAVALAIKYLSVWGFLGAVLIVGALGIVALRRLWRRLEHELSAAARATSHGGRKGRGRRAAGGWGESFSDARPFGDVFGRRNARTDVEDASSSSSPPPPPPADTAHSEAEAECVRCAEHVLASLQHDANMKRAFGSDFEFSNVDLVELQPNADGCFAGQVQATVRGPNGAGRLTVSIATEKLYGSKTTKERLLASVQPPSGQMPLEFNLSRDILDI